MAAALSFLTPSQFEQLYTDDIKPYYEYWFGDAVQKSMPTALHSATQLVVSMLLSKHGWKALPEVRLKISKVAYPVPDLVASRNPIENPYPTKPFELCLEVLSPGDQMHDAFKRCAHYLDWGIGSAWIIDPREQEAYKMTIENPQPVPIGPTGFLTAGLTEAQVSISVNELFGEAEKLVGNC